MLLTGWHPKFGMVLMVLGFAYLLYEALNSGPVVNAFPEGMPRFMAAVMISAFTLLIVGPGVETTLNSHYPQTNGAQAQIDAGKTEAKPPDKPTVTQAHLHKPALSLKQRTTSFANEFYGWVASKDKEVPGVVVTGDAKTDAYEAGKRERYTEEIRDEYDKKNFGPRAKALEHELAKCGIDIEHRALATNPLILGNLGSAMNNALLFRQFAVELPDSDKDLNCKK